MTSLEWHWGLRRLELNLDTRDNIMKRAWHSLILITLSVTKGLLPVEIGHRRRYDAGRWTLLPAKKYVDIYWNTLRRVDGRYKTTREAFPIIPVCPFQTLAKMFDAHLTIQRGNNFQYTFFPLLPGEPITRYLITAEEGHIWTSADFETHLPPRYATFPTITSHIHPRFVIVQIGLILAEYATLAIDIVRDAEHGELISRILQIYGAWTAPIQAPDFRLDTFQPSQPDRKDPSDDDNEEETHFGRRMLKRRTILKRKRSQPVSPTQDPKKGGQRSRNRSSGDSIGLSIRTLAEHEGQVKKHRWDNDALREWESEIPLYC